MNSFFQYLAEVNVYLILFYVFYAILLRNETFFNLNRAYLLGCSMISFLIPAMHSNWIKSLFITEKVRETTSIVLQNIVIRSQEQTGWTSLDMVSMIYFSGFIICLIRLIWNLVQIKQIFRKPEILQAFSFFNKIRVDQTLPQHDTILQHELVHSRQVHTADLLFFELIGIVNWFNPIVHLYKRTLKHVHEYIADEIAAEADKENYAILLLSNSFGISPNELINSFYNKSFLKRRIMMLHKMKSKKTALLKYGLSAPLFAAMLVLSSATVKEQIVKKGRTLTMSASPTKPSLASIIDSEEKTGSLIIKDQIDDRSIISLQKSPADSVLDFSTVDVLPEFPGGIAKFYEYVGSNLKYTDAAKVNGVDGRLIMSFVIEKNGALSDIKTIRDVGYGMGDEAIRMLKESPKWEAGIKNGKPVKVSYTLPITLNNNKTLQDSTQKASQTKIPANILILVEGVETRREDLSKINPENIESMRVWKGESAIEKYGDKGKDGVIEVNLKKK